MLVYLNSEDTEHIFCKKAIFSNHKFKKIPDD